MAEVFRGKTGALSQKALTMYGFHGVTALLALWLAFKAVSQ
ncbi:MAG TPA: hypothetical protein VNT75_25190 [Symbiobacteriaceae bacterium]|nr:hypothetical protein [Symbiobacteriaceae bacterium]